MLVAAGVLPWAETTLLLGVIAIAHSLPFGVRHLSSEAMTLTRPGRPSAVPPRH